MIHAEPYGKTKDGREVERYTLKNARGMSVQLITYGASIAQINVPDKSGVIANVNLAPADLAGWEANTAHFGATIGRFANRIREGKLSVDGKAFALDVNNGKNHLHGGLRGFDVEAFKADLVAPNVVEMKHVSPDGDQKYPGTLELVVTFNLSDDNVLSIDYLATTDKPTPVNFTNHMYLNLAGEGHGDILGHVLKLYAAKTTEVDGELIPTGKIIDVAGTALDFTKPHALGERIEQTPKTMYGYDLNYVIDSADGTSLRPAARLIEPVSGRTLEIRTTEPGIQLYTGNHLNKSTTGPAGVAYGPRSGVCLETQHYPDSPNHEAFPTTILRPGEVFKSRTEYRFGVE